MRIFVQKQMYADLMESKLLLGACATSSQLFHALENERISVGNTGYVNVEKNTKYNFFVRKNKKLFPLKNF